MTARAAAIHEASSWLGTPFRMGAQVRGVGVDCGRLLCAVYGAVGVPVPDRSGIGHFAPDWHLHRSEERYLGLVAQFAAEIAGPPLPADIVLFHVGRTWSHGAIVVAWPNCLIHAYWARGVEYADATKAPLQGRQMRFFSPFPGQGKE